MSTSDVDTQPVSQVPEPQHIGTEAPWSWISKAQADIRALGTTSLIYGVFFAVISLFVFWGLLQLDRSALFLSLIGGLLLIGPAVAVGLYDASRRRQQGESVRWKFGQITKAFSSSQLAFIGVILLVLFLLWLRVATLLAAIFMHTDYGALADIVRFVLESPGGIAMLVIGTLIGAAFAFTAYAISAVSIPLLMSRDVDAISAIIFSVGCVQKNFWPMMVWAWLIAILMVIGFATFCIGLIYIFPLIGHATWHAYQDLSGEEV